VAFARWDPIRDLLAIRQRLDRYAPGHAGWAPPIDVHETAAEYVIAVEVAGLTRDDIGIRIDNLPLPVDGERITADLRDGVLTVVCPKLTESGPHRVHVS
jgi:HSP20 family molecular chaperone IbpA